MSQFPPHLPPKACSIEQHHRLERIKDWLAATAFGLLAGFTGAFMVLGWIWPAVGEGEIWGSVRYPTGVSKSQLEDRIQREMSNQVVSVYAKSATLGEISYFAESDKVGEAFVVGNVDGWLAMYVPTFDGLIASWQVLGRAGGVYKVEQAIYDERAKLVYLKMKGFDKEIEVRRDEFKAVTFASDVKQFDDVFVLENGVWQRTFVEHMEPGAFSVPHLDSAPNTAYVLDRAFNVGSPVISPQGRIVGVVTSGRVVLPYSSMERALPSVLGAQKVSYATLGAEGWFNEEQPVIVDGTRVSGFAVSKIVSPRSVLRRGDVILEVNGQVMTSDVLWYTTGEEKLRLKVYRGGETVEVESGILSI